MARKRPFMFVTTAHLPPVTSAIGPEICIAGSPGSAFTECRIKLTKTETAARRYTRAIRKLYLCQDHSIIGDPFRSQEFKRRELLTAKLRTGRVARELQHHAKKPLFPPKRFDS